jgi:hypothetical protein
MPEVRPLDWGGAAWDRWRTGGGNREIDFKGPRSLSRASGGVGAWWMSSGVVCALQKRSYAFHTTFGGWARSAHEKTP